MGAIKMKNQSLELNKKIYDERYNKALERDIYEPFLEVIVKLVKDNNYSKILDYGCGGGKFGYYINKVFKKYSGILDGVDISESGLKQAKPYYSNLFNLSDRIPDKQYDLVILNSIIEHIDIDNLNILFSDISKKTHKECAIFIVVPNTYSIQRLLRGRKKALEREYKELGHVNMMSKREVVQFLKKYGFGKIEFSFKLDYRDMENFFVISNKVVSYLVRSLYKYLSIFPFYYLRNSFWIYAKRK